MNMRGTNRKALLSKQYSVSEQNSQQRDGSKHQQPHNLGGNYRDNRGGQYHYPNSANDEDTMYGYDSRRLHYRENQQGQLCNQRYVEFSPNDCRNPNSASTRHPDEIFHTPYDYREQFRGSQQTISSRRECHWRSSTQNQGQCQSSNSIDNTALNSLRGQDANINNTKHRVSDSSNASCKKRPPLLDTPSMHSSKSGKNKEQVPRSHPQAVIKRSCNLYQDDYNKDSSHIIEKKQELSKGLGQVTRKTRRIMKIVRTKSSLGNPTISNCNVLEKLNEEQHHTVKDNQSFERPASNKQSSKESSTKTLSSTLSSTKTLSSTLSSTKTLSKKHGMESKVLCKSSEVTNIVTDIDSRKTSLGVRKSHEMQDSSKPHINDYRSKEREKLDSCDTAEQVVPGKDKFNPELKKVNESNNKPSLHVSGIKEDTGKDNQIITTPAELALEPKQDSIKATIKSGSDSVNIDKIASIMGTAIKDNAGTIVGSSGSKSLLQQFLENKEKPTDIKAMQGKENCSETLTEMKSQKNNVVPDKDKKLVDTSVNDQRVEVSKSVTVIANVENVVNVDSQSFSPNKDIVKKDSHKKGCSSAKTGTSSNDIEVKYVVATQKSSKATEKQKAAKPRKLKLTENRIDKTLQPPAVPLQCSSMQVRPTYSVLQPPSAVYAAYPPMYTPVTPTEPPATQMPSYPNYQQPVNPVCNIASQLPQFIANQYYATPSVPNPAPISIETQYVNPYRSLVTPQFPILNLPATSIAVSIASDTVTLIPTVADETQPIPPTVEKCNNSIAVSSIHDLEKQQTSTIMQPELFTISDEESDDSEQVSTYQIPPKRVRKERPSTPKSHISPVYLLQLTEKINDPGKLKAASNIVREIIRVLPLRCNASITWIDKETILHAMDEIAEHFENFSKLQIRRLVLKYGFQAISPNFAPDVTNTKCDIGDDEFAIRYKESLGYVKVSEKGSDSGSDLENTERLADGKYYSCWMNRSSIYIQRLSIKSRDDKGEPISFKGFKWGHHKLTADIATSFVIRPEHRVTFYQWLSKSIPSKPPQRQYGSKAGQSDFVIMKVNLTKPKSGLKGLPKDLCECEFWEFNGTNMQCSVSCKYPRGIHRVTAFLAEDHPIQPLTFKKKDVRKLIIDCD